ncbi:MAG: hypothetical protein R3F34_06255 [Planctomycetota bacterium]
MRLSVKIAGASVLLLVAAIAIVVASDLEVTKRTVVDAFEHREELADDPWPSKAPPFDPTLVDRRTFDGASDDGEASTWFLNSSAVVLELDVPDTRSDAPPLFRETYPSHAAARKALHDFGAELLPSTATLSALAKQVDDGVVAALELHVAFDGEGGRGPWLQLVDDWRARLEPGSAAHDWLTASLVVGDALPAREVASRGANAFADTFLENARESRTVGFNDWTPELERAFRFSRFLRQLLPVGGDAAQGLVDALRRDEVLAERLRDLLEFEHRSSNWARDTSLLDVASGVATSAAFAAVRPYVGTAEAQLFTALYGPVVPSGASPMLDLVRAIRDGTIDLAPSDAGGWYEWQVHALETFVLPERGREHAKLLLTRAYKQHLIEAYSARVTTILETHIGAMGVMLLASAMPPTEFPPPLRLEPSPTYYLRVARSYAFLDSVLRAALQDYDDLHGIREGGERARSLAADVERARLLFLGCHLVSCEDIGLAPFAEPEDGDAAELERAYTLATEWLAHWWDDEDLAVDARVAMPVGPTPSGAMRHWGTRGVRPVQFTARYHFGPSMRQVSESSAEPGEWEELEAWRTATGHWWMLVDDFEEFDAKAGVPLTRAEYRARLDGR